MARLVKLPKNEQIVDVIKKIKSLKGDEVIFELPEKADLFKNPHNLSLIKKSSAAMGKTVIISTPDLAGQAMVAKAGLLLDEGGDEPTRPAPRPAPRTRKVRLGDVSASNAPRPASAVAAPNIRMAARPANVMPKRYLPDLAAPKMPRLRIPGLSTSFSKYFILGTIVLVLLVFGAAVLLPQAQITVYARSEPITRDIEVTVDQSTRSINGNTLTIPGENISRELSHTKNFPATGVKLSGNKATGSIQLYNFTKNTLTLRAATTTLIVDGKSYSFGRDVTGLRPTARIGQGTEQEVDASSLIAPVPIVAQEVGADFNQGANVRMEIQNSALGQADVYGMTVGNVSGGSSTETKVLSQEDIDKATTAMQEELPRLAEEEIAKASSNSSIKVLPNAVTSEVLAKTANKEVGAETENFDMTIIARVNGLSFNQEDVKTLVVDKINSVLSEDKYLLEGEGDELSATFKGINLEAGTGVLAVHYETTAAYKVENTNLSRILAGKNAIEIKEILLTKPEIDRVDVKFSPFFVNRAPRFNGKVYINTVQSDRQ